MGKKAKKRKTARLADVRALERRLVAVEEQLAESVVAVARGPRDAADDGVGDPAPTDGERPPVGGVTVVGSIDLPTGGHVERRWEEPTADLLAGPWDAATDRLAALAHPVRVELLRHVLRGVWSTAGLAALDIVGTTGQLYHHLNQLVAAGWLQHTGRGRYEVPGERVVPLLAVVAAARS